MSIDRPPRVDATPPRRLPRVGVVLNLVGGEWCYGFRAATLRVVAVRADISQWYAGDWVWAEVEELGPDGEVIGQLQALISVDAIRDDETQPPPTTTGSPG